MRCFCTEGLVAGRRECEFDDCPSGFVLSEGDVPTETCDAPLGGPQSHPAAVFQRILNSLNQFTHPDMQETTTSINNERPTERWVSAAGPY